MKIEILFPELCGIFGDLANAEYLCRSVPGAEIVRTPLKARPAFLDGGADAVFMGSMTEKSQELVTEVLRPHRDKIAELIDGGMFFMITGNAMEIFGSYIEDEDGSRLETLGLFSLYAKRRMSDRYNSLWLGKFENIDVVGFKSQFSHSYGEGTESLFETVRGAGRNPDDSAEGIRRNNFMATYLLGPLLVVNPPFTKRLMELLGVEGSPAFEEAAMDAYSRRLGEFSNPKTLFME